MPATGAGPSFADFREEIVALVIYQNEGGEIFHFNFPDGFHAQFRVFQQFHFFDVVLGQNGGRAADVRTLRWKDILGKSTMTRIEQIGRASCRERV